jgi:LysM repeat protein
MNPIRILASSLVGIMLVSCASQDADTYDTSNPYGTPDAGLASAPTPDAPAADPANPVYDTPAAYEESGTQSANPAYVPDAATPAPTAPAENSAAIIHTVVRGDTLSGLSAKYKVPVASIKQANRMTNDTVVLGRKMVIPPR